LLELNLDFDLTVTGFEAPEIDILLNSQKSEKADEAEMLVRAFDWFEQFKQGRSTQQIADELGINRSYVAQIMPQVFLAPDIVEDILASRQIQAESSFRLPAMSWHEQRHHAT
jgi:hypothetical protein